MKQLYAMQEATDTGSLQVNVTSRLSNAPVRDAEITISYSGEPDSILESVETDESGQTQTLTLNAPPVEYSLDSSQENQPFSLYTIQIRAEGYQPLNISGIEIFSTSKAIQNVSMTPLDYAGRFL